jgi:3-phosphoshikimate 1-carboxyvinyltransferase
VNSESHSESKPRAVLIPCVSKPITGEIRVPGSKSLTNRAVLCAAMAQGQSVLDGVLESEDTIVMIDAWRKLGLRIDWDRDRCQAVIAGCGGQPPIHQANLFVANSGTSIRFLTAALAATHGEYVLDGVPRMRQRPIGDLIRGLGHWGADLSSENFTNADCPPVKLRAKGLRGGRSSVRGDVSSQFLSGMLMAAPYCQSPVKLSVLGELVSKPYVDMTLAVMRSFGVDFKATAMSNGDSLSYQIDAPQKYRGTRYRIEPDASAASYFWAAAAITGGRVRVLGLGPDALQGDVGFVKVLQKMGSQVTSGVDQNGESWIEVSDRASHGVDINMSDISDTVQTLAAVALFADSPTRVRGVAHNRYKETDRIGDLITEIRRLGAEAQEHEDGLTIFPKPLHRCEIQTYRDHRMAMSFALVAMMVPGCLVLDPRCTEKTYPKYFEDLGRMIGHAAEYL